VVVSLILFAFAAIAATQWQERQRITEVRTEGVSMLSATSVRDVLDSCRHLDRRHLQLADVRRKLELIPFVSDAQVCFDGVRTLSAFVRERYPVAHVIMPDGSLRYMDATGMVLPPAAVRTAHDVPILRRADGGELSATELAAAARLLELARTTLHAPLYESVSEAVVDVSRGMLLITRHGTWTVDPVAVEQGGYGPRLAFENLNLYTERVGMDAALEVDLDLRWNRHVIVTRKA
jgi:cell division septal protein FtsQ